MEDTRDDAFILEVRSALGSNIARLRMERGMSQAELARIAGVDRSRLCRLESGKVDVLFDSLVAISMALKVPLAELFDGV